MNALVFIAAYNCEEFISRCLLSLERQSYKTFTILFVDDASNDYTSEIALNILNTHFDGRFRDIRRHCNVGKCANAFEYIPREDSDFVIVLDGDDYLIDDNIIEEFALFYAGGSDVVWSNYCYKDGNVGHCKALDPDQSPRAQSWRSSHLFSFKTELFRNIPETYFKDEDGNWLKSACDQAIAYPILDQTRRYKFVDRIAYFYNTENPQSHHNKTKLALDYLSRNSAEQKANALTVLGRTPMPLIHSLPETSGVKSKNEITQPPFSSHNLYLNRNA
jgi:glycosyltransferase involved in cell wall biosynthesis